MRFRVTIHSGSGAPADALDSLAEVLGERREDVVFSRVGPALEARWRGEPPSSMESDERNRIGREAIWGIVQEVCEARPELRADWYAVSPRQ